MKQNCIWLIVVIFLIPSLAKAQDIIVVPRITTGVMQYQADANFITSPLKEQLYFLSLGSTFVLKKFSFDVSYQHNVKTTEINEYGYFYEKESEINSELDRQDFSASFGYSTSYNVSLSIGYKYGKTIYDQTAQHKPIERDGTTLFYNDENNFIVKGPFIGFGYFHHLKQYNSGINFNIAIANLDGKIDIDSKLEEHIVDRNEKTILYERQYQILSDTLGLAFNTSWNQELTKKLSYSISLNYFNYNFTTKSKNFGFYDLSDVDIKEKMYSIGTSLNYRF